MSAWWDSIETVSRFNNWMQISIVVFGVLAAVASAFAILAANRISDLQDLEKTALRTELEKAKDDAASAVQAASSVAEKQKPRFLSEAAKKSLITALTPFRGTPVDITAVLGDGESFAFASQLKAMLEQSGWKANGVNQAVFSGHPVGLILVVRSQEKAPQAAGALQQALGQIGLEAPGDVDPNTPLDSVKLIVGHKP